MALRLIARLSGLHLYSGGVKSGTGRTIGHSSSGRNVSRANAIRHRTWLRGGTLSRNTIRESIYWRLRYSGLVLPLSSLLGLVLGERIRTGSRNPAYQQRT